MQTGSALLAPATRPAWEQIQRGEGGVAQLLQRFEAYFSTVAQNVRGTYLRPFVLVTANMSKGRRGRGRAVMGKGLGPPAPAGPWRTRGTACWPLFLVCELGQSH